MKEQKVYQQYKQVQVKTANNGKLLIMLYQGCIKFLRLAKKSINDDNVEDANNYIIRAQDIILELMNTLNREKGGEIATNLYNLYDFMNRHLIQANVNKDIESIEIVEELMLELLASWQEIIEGNANKENGVSVNAKG